MASNTSVATSFILITVLKVWISLAKKFLPFGMFLIFALLSSWNSQYYTWPLFASSFCGKHGLPKEVLFVSLLFLLHLFFLEVLAAIIYEQGGHKQEKMWFWRWASDRKKGTGRKHFYSSDPS